MQTVWANSFVEENNLAQNISLLRRVLGEGTDGAKFVETVSKRGYRFVASVEIIETQQPDSSEGKCPSAQSEIGEKTDKDDFSDTEILCSDSPQITSSQMRLIISSPFSKPETHYVQNGDVNIAYQVVGSGDLDIVFVMGWVSHPEYFWEEPHFAQFLNRLAPFSRLVLFDKRGTGLADRVPIKDLPTLEQRMDDVRCVMDAVSSENGRESRRSGRADKDER